MKTFVIHRCAKGESIIACSKSIADACVWAHKHWPGEQLHIRQLRLGEGRLHAMAHPVTAAHEHVRASRRAVA